ncbi:hypothetical protein TREPR_3096 [Treponema primitia ZAS-2]|uniref:Uncharacterized protein n=1 Tax=Treponema primitia (strain ATCC BAA-887 / DSM 12427 / ZAS-2) TaxID=545694 RepID=F5YML2_TREPZ|nr:hypothetical protein [Treponema primitia]AEF83948.1 hypothetical protein TREPR_3096 [Treponema primitia ZAS-2]AEL20846.1 hypothetical protein [Treponema primitia ZAS-2]
MKGVKKTAQGKSGPEQRDFLPEALSGAETLKGEPARPPAGEPIVVRCADCAEFPCSIKCDSNAIAYVCGDLMIELDKCAVCGQYKGNSIPDCVVSCGFSQEKAVLEIPSVGMKQIRAANALSLLKL